MKESQFYGGSQEEAKNGLACQAAREKAIANGFTVRREKRGKETVLVITPAQPNSHLQAIDATYHWPIMIEPSK